MSVGRLDFDSPHRPCLPPPRAPPAHAPPPCAGLFWTPRGAATLPLPAHAPLSVRGLVLDAPRLRCAELLCAPMSVRRRDFDARTAVAIHCAAATFHHPGSVRRLIVVAPRCRRLQPPRAPPPPPAPPPCAHSTEHAQAHSGRPAPPPPSPFARTLHERAWARFRQQRRRCPAPPSCTKSYPTQLSFVEGSVCTT
ncbi:hypothetical protein GGX14DRAFT_578232 [Mycena pura]|uniref:Uncharacterized protein n=1 Tax=Mycena pura TaxID=153505 RepID=A0AAD6URX7_9AGAR|nr:hypothetical protein GGX14DRAFT_578232 [Mycena pura]